MPGGQGNRAAWPSNDDFTFLSLAVVVIGLGFLGWLGWTNYHAVVADVVAHVARWEIGLVRHFTPALDSLDLTIVAANLNAVTVPEILGVLNQIGHYLRIPVVVFILILAVLCFTRAAPSKFTRALDLDGLIAELTPTFGSIAAFARRNLRLVPLQPSVLRPSDPALHAREWVQYFASPARGVQPLGATGMDEQRAIQAFTDQLGPIWRGVDNAPDHVRLLYAAFALHLEQRRPEACDLSGGAIDCAAIWRAVRHCRSCNLLRGTGQRGYSGQCGAAFDRDNAAGWPDRRRTRLHRPCPHEPADRRAAALGCLGAKPVRLPQAGRSQSVVCTTFPWL